ncbi:MAG: xanthine dehydrogenase family protein subunit M [Chloroflexi bacterium]|nr:xanthine dehydrogenase family protein subunit M [Chloroflexota bacterium]
MRPFEYVRPTTVGEATDFLREHGDDALVVAGGTAAVVMMTLGVLRPDYVVDVGFIPELGPELDGSRSGGAGLRLGALTTVRSIERDPAIAGAYGLLADAASQVANVRVRNRATVGGSVCYGEPQTDLPPALIAMGASATIAASTGVRTVPLAGFFEGPYETVLQAGELLTEITVPLPEPGTFGCHAKFTVGSPENKPVANASVLVRTDEAGRCVEARIVMGAVGPVPVVAEAAAALLAGEVPDAKLIAEVAARAADATDPQDDLRGPVWYKRRIAAVLVERALSCALRKAGNGTR